MFFKFCPFQTENELLTENLLSYEDTPADPTVMQIRNQNKTKIELFGDKFVR